MKPLSRRSVIAGSAAVVTAIPAVGLAKALPQQSSGLAELVRRYYREVDAFNADPRLDDDEFFHADQPYDLTMAQMIGVPARSAEDALAGLDWLIKEGVELSVMSDLDDPDLSPFDQTVTSLVAAVRGYIAEGRS